jgi:hypothetical protein
MSKLEVKLALPAHTLRHWFFKPQFTLRPAKATADAEIRLLDVRLDGSSSSVFARCKMST